MPLSQQTAIGQAAPDFQLTDVQGRTIRLADYQGRQHVILIFTRGFM